MPTNYEHCAALVREADRDRYLATLFAPAEHRDALYSLYAFNVEITRVRELAREPMPGEIRLQWWREALGGEREGEAAAHPVAAALLATLSRYGFVATPLLELIDEHTFDLYDEPMATVGALELYAIRTQSPMFAMAAGILKSGGAAVRNVHARRQRGLYDWRDLARASDCMLRAGSFMCRWKSWTGIRSSRHDIFAGQHERAVAGRACRDARDCTRGISRRRK